MLSPLADRGDPWLFLSLVTNGAMNIEQGGRVLRVGPREIVRVQSSHANRRSFGRQTDMTSLRFSSNASKARDLRHDLRGPITPDMSAADTLAIRDLVMSIAAKRGATSVSLRRHQADQLLGLIDLLIDDPVAVTRARSSDGRCFAPGA